MCPAASGDTLWPAQNHKDVPPLTVRFFSYLGVCIALIRAIAIPCLLAPALAFAAASEPKRFDLTIANAAVPPQQRVMRVHKDDVVQLRVTSDAPGEVHLHGYRQEVKVVPGRAAELTFKAHATGRYRIEWHPTGDKAQKSNHHGPALATLEVRPR